MTASPPRRPPLSAAVIAAGARAHYDDAEYYEQAYRRRREDVRFYVREGVRSKGPVLELGAGTGRIATALARAGVEVVGLERERAMLARAEARRARLPRDARPRLHLRRGDLRSFRLGRRFPLVIAPFNVFMHLYTRRDLERALACISHHLMPGGRLVFDVLVPDPDLLASDPKDFFPGRSFRHTATGERFRYGESFRYDPVRQVLVCYMTFTPEGRPQDAFVTPLSQRQWFPEELEAVLHYAGWRTVRRLGSFLGGPLGPESEELIVVAARR